MNYPTCKDANKAFDEAHAFELVTADWRIIIYGEHTDGAGRNARFWLCYQAKIDLPCGFSVGGQLYLDKDGLWREPHGAASRRHFSTPSAAIKAANKFKP